MRIVEAGDDAPAARVDDFGGLAGPVFDVGRAADIHDAIADDGQSFGSRHSFIAGPYFRVCHDDIGEGTALRNHERRRQPATVAKWRLPCDHADSDFVVDKFINEICRRALR